MNPKRLFHATITHKLMVHAEDASHAEKIVRSHLHDKAAEWPLGEEIAHSSDILARQTPVTNQDGLAEGYLDVSPWSDIDEPRTCKEILQDEEKEREAKKDDDSK